MDAVVAIIRPKQIQSHRGPFLEMLEVLLMDIRISNTDRSKTIKQLPKVTVGFDEEPTDVVLKFVYSLTGEGLKGSRALFINTVHRPGSRHDLTSTGDQRDSYLKGNLFCVPVDHREKMGALSVADQTSMPSFYPLHYVMESANSNAATYSRQTKMMLHRLESWLKECHSIPNVVDSLFRKPSLHRLGMSVFNPAYVTSNRSSGSINQPDGVVQDANEALAKMMAIEKCDIVVMNPLFGSGLPFQHKVDAFAMNKFWGSGIPDYTKIKVQPEPKIESSDVSFDDYPLHKKAYEGDAPGLRELIAKKHSVTQRDRNSWTPIHYAVWYGHLEAIQVLLDEGGCPPNIINKKRSTPLHFAALCGHPYVVELLLSHRDIDVHALDREGNTPLSLCQKIPEKKPEHESCSRLLEEASKRPCPKIDVFLMDGSHRSLNLVSNVNTTVHHLHLQMLERLEIPDVASSMFTIWICSPNLQLQLKKEHCPVDHMQKWPDIVLKLTTFDPSKEKPRLVWRRDARLSIDIEKKTRDTAAVNLLFHEAYFNYIRSFYPCAEQDAVMLGAILMQLKCGDYDPKKAKTLIETNIWELVPATMLKSKSTNWSSKLEKEYKNFTQQMAGKERSPAILQYQFLIVCWNLVVYGSAFFSGSLQLKPPKNNVPVHIGVNDIGVHIIHAQSKNMLFTYAYADLAWFYRVIGEDQEFLELKPKSSPKEIRVIHTKQASLIDHLMSKMSQLHNGPVTPT